MRRGRLGHYRPSRTAQAGFSLLEFAVVVSIIAILAVIAVDRLWALRLEAERVAVAQVVGALRSALGIEVARRALEDGLGSLPELHGSNPMALLAQRPAGYAGELTAGSAGQVEGGQWYFDPVVGVLVYRARFRDAFEGLQPGSRDLWYRVVMIFTDTNGNGAYDSASERINGLDLRALAL